MVWWQTLLVSMLGGLVSLGLKWVFDALFLRRKVRSEKDLFIHQRQFEKEFDAYVAIWNCLPDYSDCRRGDESLTTADLIQKKSDVFKDTVDALNTAIRTNEPFLCDEVLTAIQELRAHDKKYASAKGTLDRHTSRDGYDSDRAIDLDEKCEAALKGIQTSIDNIKSTIRARVWNKR